MNHETTNGDNDNFFSLFALQVSMKNIFASPKPDMCSSSTKLPILIVGCVGSCSLCCNRSQREVLPTPESPTHAILNFCDSSCIQDCDIVLIFLKKFVVVVSEKEK